MYLPRFDPWEIYLAFIYIILSSLFRYKELKMALISLDLHSITLFWQLKFWAVFGRVFVSFWAGNHPSNLATLCECSYCCYEAAGVFWVFSCVARVLWVFLVLLWSCQGVVSVFVCCYAVARVLWVFLVLLWCCQGIVSVFVCCYAVPWVFWVCFVLLCSCLGVGSVFSVAMKLLGCCECYAVARVLGVFLCYAVAGVLWVFLCCYAVTGVLCFFFVLLYSCLGVVSFFVCCCPFARVLWVFLVCCHAISRML